MKLFRKNPSHRKNLSIFALLFYILIIGSNCLVYSSQENYIEEMELSNTTKDGYENKSAIPTNPFEIVDMLRKVNSMNDATIPSDAIDDAIESFNNLKLNNN